MDGRDELFRLQKKSSTFFFFGDKSCLEKNVFSVRKHFSYRMQHGSQLGQVRKCLLHGSRSSVSLSHWRTNIINQILF